ncbi:PLD nuclease N-terminal domain-containing protein [Paenibacillus sp.]|uniref:PLD nuclease N-terminal domain-containing protein n=1 Tax=Paenibacillus sp. TaxID=58172 RepID=UPI002828C4AE|nr:PLD nuclease N-terminal domain-containing protein [Paenibacillus sp.]MDR0266982.1 PLD nuclease N-terminal domain-containing protein [Paenibacillus sp.]
MHTEIPWNLIAPLLAIYLILAVMGLTSLYKADSTRGPKWMWAIVILFVSVIGPVAYFVIGRKETS